MGVVDQNTQNTPRDLRLHPVTQTPMKSQQITLTRKSSRSKKNNILSSLLKMVVVVEVAVVEKIRSFSNSSSKQTVNILKKNWKKMFYLQFSRNINSHTHTHTHTHVHIIFSRV